MINIKEIVGVDDARVVVSLTNMHHKVVEYEEFYRKTD